MKYAGSTTCEENKMKLATLLLGLLSVPAAFAAPSAVEQQLIDAENAWAQAVMKSDVAALEKLYADEYLFTDPSGMKFTKSQDIANTRTGDLKLTAYRLGDLQVHVYGDVATVTGSNTITATFHGADASGQYRFTDVFVKRDGRWQVVATQGTKVTTQ